MSANRREKKPRRRSRFLPTPRAERDAISFLSPSQPQGRARGAGEPPLRFNNTPPFRGRVRDRIPVPLRPALISQRQSPRPQAGGIELRGQIPVRGRLPYMGVENAFRSVRGVSFSERTPEQARKDDTLDKSTLAELINKISGRTRKQAQERERKLTLSSMLEKHSAIFTPSKLTSDYDRQGYTLAERLVISAMERDRDDPARGSLLVDLEQVLGGGGRYSPNNPLFADLDVKRDADILEIFAGNTDIRDTLLGDILELSRTETRAADLEKVKVDIVKKFLGGNIEGAKEDLRGLGEEDRLSVQSVAAEILWSEGLKNQSPEQLALSASLTPGMASAERGRTADRLKTWQGASDPEREVLAKKPMWQNLLQLLDTPAESALFSAQQDR